jgi:hypothetical protein
MAVPKSTHLLAPIRQLSSNSRNARIFVTRVQWVFIVEHYLAPLSYLSCQNKFMDTFPDCSVPSKSTVSRLINRSRDNTKPAEQKPFRSTFDVKWRYRTQWTFAAWTVTLLVFWFHCNLFVDKQNMSGVRVAGLFDNRVIGQNEKHLNM